MVQQVVGLLNRRRTQQITGRRAQAKAHQPHRSTHQVLVSDHTASKGTVDAFLDEVDHALAAADIQLNLWMPRSELR
ncbi:hypothetical protein D9M68_831690 [compost metagenome]